MNKSHKAFNAFDEIDRPAIDIINDCVHCGFCLPACPTYVDTRNELDSPRGRIYLMKNAVEGKIPMDESFVSHIDLCLGCLACQTACPSGVHYSSLIETTRSQIERRYKRDYMDKKLRDLIFKLFPYKNRLRLLLPLLVFYQYSGLKYLLTGTVIAKLLPSRLESLLALSPPVRFSTLLKSANRSVRLNNAKYKVALLTGCVQSVFFPEVHISTINVLKKLGCSIDIPDRQGCCGALSLHSGRLNESREFARKIIDQFSKENYDAIIVNSAGCGSSMKEYFNLFRDDKLYSEKARILSSRTKDILEFIHSCNLTGKMNKINLKLTYQDACHISHGQRIRTAPRELLKIIPGIEYIEMPESDMCCGSAGIYNLTQQEMSGRLLDRKLSNLKKLDVDLLVVGNPGCLLQIQSGLKKHNINLQTCHPVELLDRALQ